MALDYVIDHVRRRLDVTATGVVTYDAVRAHIADEERDGGLPFHEMIDGTTADLRLTPEQVRLIVDDLRRVGTRGVLGPTAVLVGSDFAFGMMRMLETLTEDVCAIRPFRDRDEAERWLAEQPPTV